MPFILVHVRPSPEEGGQYAVLSSQSPYVQQESSEKSARRFITATSTICATPSLVVIFDGVGPVSAHKVVHGKWNDLALVTARPIPDDPAERYLYGRAGAQAGGPPVANWR
jgi:hypothetical protein